MIIVLSTKHYQILSLWSRNTSWSNDSFHWTNIEKTQWYIANFTQKKIVNFVESWNLKYEHEQFYSFDRKTRDIICSRNDFFCIRVLIKKNIEIFLLMFEYEIDMFYSKNKIYDLYDCEKFCSKKKNFRFNYRNFFFWNRFR